MTFKALFFNILKEQGKGTTTPPPTPESLISTLREITWCSPYLNMNVVRFPGTARLLLFVMDSPVADASISDTGSRTKFLAQGSDSEGEPELMQTPLVLLYA